MKVKFDGRVYDTETATLLVGYTNGLPITDDYYVDTFLYVKKNGEYFLHCHGGAKSEYSFIKDNKAFGGEHIIPIMNKKLKYWVSGHSELINFMLFWLLRKNNKKIFYLSTKKLNISLAALLSL